jgi:hypothetical protein
VLRQAVRASSAVECMNSVLRMHQELGNNYLNHHGPGLMV